MENAHWGAIFDVAITMVFQGFVVVAAFVVGEHLSAEASRLIKSRISQRLVLYLVALVMGLAAARFDMPYCGEPGYECPGFLDIRGKNFEESVVVTVFVALAAIGGFEWGCRRIGSTRVVR